MKKTIYLVRHAESEINLDHDNSTIIDEESPLSEKGREQAHIVAERCAKLPVEALIASTQMRARETVAAIRELVDLPVAFSDLFIERQFPSDVIGKPRGEMKERLRQWSQNYFTTDGEFSDLKVRGGKALKFLEEYPASSILVVTHGFFMRMLLAQVIFGASLSVDEFKKFIKATRTDNTGITVLTYGTVPQHALDPDEERWMIRVYNDHAHLG